MYRLVIPDVEIRESVKLGLKVFPIPYFTMKPSWIPLLFLKASASS